MALERFDWKTCFSFKGIKGVRAAYELKGEGSNDDFYFFFCTAGFTAEAGRGHKMGKRKLSVLVLRLAGALRFHFDFYRSQSGGQIGWSDGAPLGTRLRRRGDNKVKEERSD